MVTERNLREVTSNLTIKDLASTDFDTYTCTIINLYGSASAMFILKQKSKLFAWIDV